MEKKITRLNVRNANTPIKSRGEVRSIKIHGTPGSGFSLEINDSNGDCILEEPLQNVEIPKSNVYILNQKFPDISTSATGGLIEESYEIILTPHADVGGGDPIIGGGISSIEVTKIILYQYPDVTITLATAETSIHSEA